MQSLKELTDAQRNKQQTMHKGEIKDAQQLGIDLDDLPENYRNETLYRLGQASQKWVYQLEITQERERYQRQLEALRDLIDTMIENIPKNS